LSYKECIDRITRLEQHINEYSTYRKAREESDKEAETRDIERQQMLNNDLRDVKEELATISEYLSTQKGFIGGAIFIIGAITSVITLFADKLFR